MGKLVILESPYAGEVEKNLDYARKCMNDCFLRGEYPFASHLLYPQNGILDDVIKTERELGINAGLAWGKFADKTVVYADLGITDGMRIGMKNAFINKRKIEIRTLWKD